ncbi:MAG: imidazole glycerol phosphate synthase subunit HisH [Bdellovibrionales bacterium]|nr:imidazole glycerol phosphate synthase subunit HisH [Bdellovibrionales bacterium]
MIKILSYGSGNVKAIHNIYKRLNIPSEIASSADALANADKLILPGVGAFDETLDQLERSGMRQVLDHMVLERQTPVLGVCVGMQIMGNRSDEGLRDGLGWIPGEVKRLEPSLLEQKPHLPHMGWNTIAPTVAHPLLEGIDPERGFYFLHSYYFSCSNVEHILTTTTYGVEFASAVHSGNIFGLQFHPEKSHENGVMIFRNFAEI